MLILWPELSQKGLILTDHSWLNRSSTPIKLTPLYVSLAHAQKICGAYVYLLFMAVALFAFTFTWIRLPETKGRTFDDIAEEFRGAEGIPLHNKTPFNTFT